MRGSLGRSLQTDGRTRSPREVQAVLLRLWTVCGPDMARPCKHNQVSLDTANAAEVCQPEEEIISSPPEMPPLLYLGKRVQYRFTRVVVLLVVFQALDVHARVDPSEGPPELYVQLLVKFNDIRHHHTKENAPKE